MVDKIVLPEELQNINILVIDDMSFYVSFLKQALLGLGHKGNIITATSNKDTISILNECIKNKTQVHFIITDYNLSDGPCSSLIKKLRETKKWGNVPILVFTVEENGASVLETLEAGADNYFFKPIDQNIVYEKMLYCWNKHHFK